MSKYEVLYGLGLPWWLSSKEPACQAGDSGSILGLGRSPGEGNSNPLQYSCLGNPMARGSWWATVLGVQKNWTRLSTRGHMTLYILLLKDDRS